jgi:hypothetical protein
MACPACNSLRHIHRADLGAQIYECRECRAIHGSCYLGDSYTIVRPHFASAETLATAQAAETIRYYDLMTLGSKGVERRHGWFDTVSRLITQVG